MAACTPGSKTAARHAACWCLAILDLILAVREERKLTAKLTLQFEDKIYVLHDTRKARQYIGQRITAPIETDSKNMDYVLEQLTAIRKTRASRHRNPTPNDIADRVRATKGLAAKSAKRRAKSPSVQSKNN
jgi:hypothetical protein